MSDLACLCQWPASWELTSPKVITNVLHRKVFSSRTGQKALVTRQRNKRGHSRVLQHWIHAFLPRFVVTMSPDALQRSSSLLTPQLTLNSPSAGSAQHCSLITPAQSSVCKSCSSYSC